MQAIVTKYHPATDRSGSRVSARAEAGRVILFWNDSLGSLENHDAAALALCQKFDWRGTLAEGSIPTNPSGHVYVFCHTERPSYEGEWTAPKIVGPFRG